LRRPLKEKHLRRENNFCNVYKVVAGYLGKFFHCNQTIGKGKVNKGLLFGSNNMCILLVDSCLDAIVSLVCHAKNQQHHYKTQKYHHTHWRGCRIKKRSQYHPE
jgi:hypothetical protein